MRRVDAEGDSQQSNRRRKRSGARSSPAQNPNLRRMSLEALEARTLLSTLPTPVTALQSFVGSGITSGAANSSSPSVAIDPLNPQKMVAAWTTFDPGNKLDGPNGQVTTYVQGFYSLDGGVTWTELPGDTDADVQLDFGVAPVTSGVQPDFSQTTDATVAFGRDQTAYLLSSTHSANGGVLDLQSWNFSTATAVNPPKQNTFTRPAYDSASASLIPTTLNPIYRWQKDDAALAPTLAVDDNLPSFDDGGGLTQTDPFAGNVYVAWESQDTAPKNVIQNPNVIKLMASSNNGQNFTYQAYLDNHGQGNLYDSPKIAISQGTPTASGNTPAVPGGQVTIVYDNAGPGGSFTAGAGNPNFDTVQTKADTLGGTDAHFDSAKGVPLVLASGVGSTTTPATVGITDIPIDASNITNVAGFVTLQNLTLTLSLQFPTLANTSATLVSPTGTTITLWNNATDNTGTATNKGSTLTGANIGASTLTPFIGTVLDSTANRSLFDGNVAAPYTGHFQPSQSLIAQFKGMTAAALKGTWHLMITDWQGDTTTAPPRVLIGASLDFTSGVATTNPRTGQKQDLLNSAANPINSVALNSGAKTFTDGIQGVPVLANPSIASDNTLGLNSPNQGRLYVAVTNDNFNFSTGAPTTSTFIELYSSDDGGTTWNFNSIVNDDDGLTDGFSTAGYAQPASVLLASQADPFVEYFGNLDANVRPKIEPQVAVDQYTGTVVVSYLDTRNDASAVRVANYIAASTDGGATFAPESYANPTTNAGQLPVEDAITGAPVIFGPVPDNESSGNNDQETTFGFGQHQGLAVANGEIIPVWASNQNDGSKTLNQKVPLNIESAVVNYADGPRVIASTQGPVGQPGDTVNTAREADGTPIANTIVFTFDRAVNPATFLPDVGDVLSPLEVFYNNPNGTSAPIRLPVTNVVADTTDTVFTVTFDPTNPLTGLPYGVGSYSYILQPFVQGMIPYQSLLNVIEQVPILDSAGVTGPSSSSFTVAGFPGVALVNASITANIDVYQAGTGPNTTGMPDVQIFLVPQGQTPIQLFSTPSAAAAAGTVIPVSAQIPIPAGQLLDQTYTIMVVDNVPGQGVFVFNDVNPGDFNFQVQLDVGLTTTIPGNLLDQNADGVPGEQPDDNYAIPDGRQTLPLIVPGPHVVSTTAVGVNGTVSSGTDNLVNNDNVNAVNVTFDRDMQVGSFTPAQVLSVQGPTGRVDGPQTFVSTGIAKNFAFNGSFQLIPKAPATGPNNGLTSSIFISNTGSLLVSNLTVQVNVTDPNDSSLSLALQAPNGVMVPLVNAGTAAGANFTNTVFSDAPAANGLNLTIPTGQAPYALTYKPASPLSALAGVALQGTWKLIIVDSTNAGAQGRLNGWSLNITPQVPTGPGTALNSPLVVSAYPDNSFTIAHLAVQLNVASTKDADLQINLISPTQPGGGQITVPLVLSGATSGQNFLNTTFDDNGTIAIGAGAAPYNLTYRPAGMLSALNGLSINGTWTLQIVNPNVDGSVTTLNSWSLIATPQITITPVNPVNGAARTFTVGFPTQTLSGTYTVTLSPNILSVQANPANTSMGTPLDTNLNAGVYNIEGISTGPTTSDVFNATAVPVAIPYAVKPANAPKVPGVLTSQIDVTDNFAVQGDVGSLAGLTLTLNIAYYFDPDLTVTLTAPGPNGRTITLFSGVGKGGNNANFTNTTLSDTVTPLAPITAAGAPFFGTFNPEQPLSLLTTDTTGATQFSGGLWTLTITNTGTGSDHGIPNNIAAMLNSWSLDFQKPQANTGLGEPVADQVTVGFRLFNIAPSDPLANDTWTAVGPAGTVAAANPNNLTSGAANGADLGGPVSVVAIDPADPSGNTAYIGAASGGVWKTTDFLTTKTGGPTYVPLTDFGTNYSINIGSIAIFDQNNDPNQSIVFAGTGDGQATTANQGNAVQGVGILRSTNGGASFTLLDSTVNVDANGNPLPINSPLRDHIFVGTTTYKIVVDPHTLPNGGVIVYAALGGPHGGLYRSDDGGNHWQNLSTASGIPLVNGQPAAATDILLDPASASSSTGNLDIAYAAFQGVGVFISSNRGLGLTELLGNDAADNLIQDSQVAGASPLTVGNVVTPNGNFGRIVLAKPALTTNASENILYQDWLYVAVENTNGTFKGLYITKDRGENWTKVQIASIPDTGLVPTIAEPTNDNTQANNYDFTNGATVSTHNGNSAFSLAVDPSNPNIVYLGGTSDYQTSGLIRLDLTGLYDAHAFAPFANDLNDGGSLTVDSNGRVNSNPLVDFPPFFQGVNPASTGTGFNYTNLRHSPITVNAFDVNSTQFVFDSTAFNNSGYGVKWIPIDATYDSPTDGSSNIHQLLTIVDPLTGLTRLIIADDQGVFTGLYNADGSLNTSGIGTQPGLVGSLNGNLQDEELYDTAAQPSSLAAQTAGALFYGSGIGMTDAQSDPNLLSDGNLTWTVQGPAYGDLQNLILDNNRGGTGIATDPTGGTTISNPIGTGPSLYEFDTPQLGGDTTNFFRVNNSGQTTGLVNNFRVEFPANGVLPNGNGVSQLGNFTVNPLNGSQILISSTLGNVYETVNKGVQWLEIGAGQAVAPGVANFDGTFAQALTYGAPDPNAPSGLGNLNNFIYVGTIGTEGSGGNVPGHIYVTTNGGGTWQSISNGLDGSSVVAIYTNPNRGSHEAYAVTLNGVYYMANSLAPNATWVNITGNLAQIQHNSFGDPTLAQNALLGYTGTNGQLGGFRSIVADYRYAVPDPVTPSVTYPILYVAGYGGVFRSLDNGQTWTAFPDTNFDSAPAEGGYLPNVDVTSLQFDLGAINPATGHATQNAGDREILLASTLGRGDFAIGLAPIVLPHTILLDPTLPAPGGSDSGAANGNPDVTNVVTPFIDGVSEISNFGNTITINIYDETGGPGQGTLLGTGTTDPSGHFSIQLVNNGSDPSFFTSSTSIDDKIIGVQATDISGASGNITKFAYTLDTITPNTPSGVVLESKYDTGRSNSDDITDLSIPAPTPGSGLSIVTPIFDVSTPLPPANPLTPFPITLTVELLRSLSPTGPFTVVASVPGGSTSPVMLSDPGLAALAAAAQINTTFYYEAEQVDQAGNVSLPSPVLAVTVITVTPPTLPAPTLDPSTNSGSATPPYETSFTMPKFDVVGLLPTDQLYLYRSVNGSTPVLVGVQNTIGLGQVTDTTVGLVDGVYTYYVAQQDIAGNFSALSPGVVVTINTQTPPNTPVLEPLYDTGRFNNDDITNIAIPMPTPGVTPTFVPPLFDITTVPPPAGQPATVTVELLRSTSPTGPFAVVGFAPYVLGTTKVTDTSLAGILAAGPTNMAFYYESDQIDAAGIKSNPSGAPPLKVTADNIVPSTLVAPTLDITTNTGLVKTPPYITNNTHPLFDATGLGTALGVSNQLLLYRSTGGNKPILVGTAAVGASQVMDTTGAIPDGVYLYSVAQEDLAGNISALSPSVSVTVNTQIPAAPTINLLNPSGAPSHPLVTNVRTPTLFGTAPFNAGPTNFPLDILIVTNGNNAGGTVIASTFPAANGTYQVTVAQPLADGVYTLVARTKNLAGTPNYSAPLTITIKANGPQITPSLSILPADDTGIKLDGVTANHHPRFTGITDPGDTVTLYSLTNGVLSAPLATTTSSTINGSFTIQLPFFLSDGSTQLVARTTDIAGNAGLPSTALNLRIISVAGDYYDTGAAQLAIFDPNTETYYVRGGGFVSVDPTSNYRDVPIQYDFNGDGATDFTGYRFDSATYIGLVSTNSTINFQYGLGGVSLPTSGYFNPNGTFTFANFGANSAYWAVALPQPGGLVVKFVVPMLDIPVPAAYDGGGLTEIAVFRPSASSPGATDADSFSVAGPVTAANPVGYYQVSFTNPNATFQATERAAGYTYKAGDIPAPADYDGIGSDEFAIYRPTTGQFFILNTHNSDLDPTKWTIRTVTMNLPGGPNANDVPVSEDYDGNGKIDPTVYRPSNSTFYMIHSSTGLQENIQYGLGNFDIAPAGPLLYRLTALRGQYASTGGYPSKPTGGTTPGTGGGVGALAIHASAATSTSPSSTPIPSLVALAAPVVVTTPTLPVASALISTPTTAPASTLPVSVGATTPKSVVPTVTTSKPHQTTKSTHPKTVEKAKKPATPLKVETKAHAVETKAHAVESKPKVQPAKAKPAAIQKHGAVMAAVTALQHLVMARKGKPKPKV